MVLSGSQTLADQYVNPALMVQISGLEVESVSDAAGEMIYFDFNKH